MCFRVALHGAASPQLHFIYSNLRSLNTLVKTVLDRK